MSPAREHSTRNWRPVKRCYCQRAYDGTAVCSCEFCHGGRRHRNEPVGVEDLAEDF